MVLIDTTILIEYFRKKNKAETVFYRLAAKNIEIAISSLTKYEVFVGSNIAQEQFWNDLFEALVLIPFADKEAMEAVRIQKDLLRRNKIIGFADVGIGATALANNLEIATLNNEHFSRIEGLEMYTFD